MSDKVAKVEDLDDMGVLEGGDGAGLLLEAAAEVPFSG